MSSTRAKVVFVVFIALLSIGLIGFVLTANTPPNSTTTSLNTTVSTIVSTANETVTVTQTPKIVIYHLTVQFTLFNNPQVQYILYINGNSIGTGILDSNSSIPIPTSSKGNVTVSTLIQSNNVNQNVEITIFNNGTTIAVGYNGVNQRNNVTGFVN